MPLSLVEIEREVGQLTQEERERLVELLIASLEPSDQGDIEAAGRRRFWPAPRTFAMARSSRELRMRRLLVCAATCGDRTHHPENFSLSDAARVQKPWRR